MRIVTILTELVIAGEALALLVGTHLPGKSRNPWRSRKNDLLIALDLLPGGALVYLPIQNHLAAPAPIFLALVGLALFTHLYREWEYLARAANPFCANLPLFIVNNLKLAGMVAIVVLSASKF